MAERLYPIILTQASKVLVEILSKYFIIKQLFLFLLSEKRCTKFPLFVYFSRPVQCCEPRYNVLKDTDYGFRRKRIKDDNQAEHFLIFALGAF